MWHVRRSYRPISISISSLIPVSTEARASIRRFSIAFAFEFGFGLVFAIAMTCFVDHSGLMLYMGGSIALVGYVVSLFSSNKRLLHVQLGLLLSLATYALMSHSVPSVWDTRFPSVFTTIVVITVAYNCAAAIAANLAFAFVSLALLAPFVHHCDAVITAFFVSHGWPDVPLWFGTTIVVACAAVGLLVLHLSGIEDALARLVRTLVTSACVAFYAHLAWIEWRAWSLRAEVDEAAHYDDGDADAGGIVTSGALLCCGAIDDTLSLDPHDMCPFALDNVLVDVLFVALLLLSVWATMYRPCARCIASHSVAHTRLGADADADASDADANSCANDVEASAFAAAHTSTHTSAPALAPTLTRYERIQAVRLASRAQLERDSY